MGGFNIDWSTIQPSPNLDPTLQAILENPRVTSPHGSVGASHIPTLNAGDVVSSATGPSMYGSNAQNFQEQEAQHLFRQ